MFKIKLSNSEIVTFTSKDELLNYVSNKWSVQKYQVIIEDNYIYLTTKLGNIFAAIRLIE